MKKKVKKSEQLPKYGTVLRSRLVESIEDLPGYKEGIQKGFPLFTKKELDDIKKRYEKDKLTWQEIDKILSKKGIFLKKATFRKYIQDGNISEAIGYKNTGNSRVALFPEDAIAHINFIQFFYKVLEKKVADQILEIVQDWKITYAEAIEHLLNENLFQLIIEYIVYGNYDVTDAFRESLNFRPTERDNIVKTLEDIADEYNKTIATKISKLIDLLEEKTMNFSETMKEGNEAMWKRKKMESQHLVEEGLPSMKKYFAERTHTTHTTGREVPVSETIENGKGTKNE